MRRDGNVVPAQIPNVSDDGFAIRLLDHARLDAAITVRFSIPGAKEPVVAIATVCWSTEPIFGMKFISMG